MSITFDVLLVTAMNVLDADEKRLYSNGKYAVRDIVQVISDCMSDLEWP